MSSWREEKGWWAQGPPEKTRMGHSWVGNSGNLNPEELEEEVEVFLFPQSSSCVGGMSPEGLGGAQNTRGGGTGQPGVPMALILCAPQLP